MSSDTPRTDAALLECRRMIVGYWPENDPMRKYSEGEPERGRELPAGK